MSIIMMFYYFLSAFIVAMLIWNFIKSENETDELVQYLIVCVPLILRILRIK